MGDLIQFRRPDGEEAPGYLARPAGGDDAPGVVVIQEWWGLNAQIRKVADRLADAGFRALAPDFYRGKIAPDADEANHMMTDLDWGAAAQQDVRGALQFLKAGGRRAAVLGFCMGGALTLIAAARVEETDASVCFYGIPPGDAADPAHIKKPILLHFANQDDWCTPDAVNGLEGSLKAAKVDFELHRYDAQHAFFNETRPEVYDEDASSLAWSRTLDFLKKSL